VVKIATFAKPETVRRNNPVAIQSSLSNLKISLTVVLKTSEIFIARTVDGTYLSASIEFIV
jgi:hypothetical protein